MMTGVSPFLPTLFVGRIDLRNRGKELMEEDAKVLINGKGSGWRCWMMGRKTRSWMS